MTSSNEISSRYWYCSMVSTIGKNFFGEELRSFLTRILSSKFSQSPLNLALILLNFPPKSLTFSLGFILSVSTLPLKVCSCAFWTRSAPKFLTLIESHASFAVDYCATCINTSCDNVWKIITFDVLSFFSFVVDPSFATTVPKFHISSLLSPLSMPMSCSLFRSIMDIVVRHFLVLELMYCSMCYRSCRFIPCLLALIIRTEMVSDILLLCLIKISKNYCYESQRIRCILLWIAKGFIFYLAMNHEGLNFLAMNHKGFIFLAMNHEGSGFLAKLYLRSKKVW